VFSITGIDVWLYSALQLRPAVFSKTKCFRKISRHANVTSNNADIVRYATTFSIRFPAVHLHAYSAAVPVCTGASCQNDNRAVMLSERRELAWLFVGE
jgi:hypothetical protein